MPGQHFPSPACVKVGTKLRAMSQSQWLKPKTWRSFDFLRQRCEHPNRLGSYGSYGEAVVQLTGGSWLDISLSRGGPACSAQSPVVIFNRPRKSGANVLNASKSFVNQHKYESDGTIEDLGQLTILR